MRRIRQIKVSKTFTFGMIVNLIVRVDATMKGDDDYDSEDEDEEKDQFPSE